MISAYKTIWECEHCGAFFRSLLAARLHGSSIHSFSTMCVSRWRGTMMKNTFDKKKTLYYEMYLASSDYNIKRKVKKNES